MLGHPPYSYDTLRKYQMAFGTLFNDIEIVRRDRDGNVQQQIKVPLSWSRKDKLSARLLDDPDLTRARRHARNRARARRRTRGRP